MAAGSWARLLLCLTWLLAACEGRTPPSASQPKLTVPVLAAAPAAAAPAASGNAWRGHELVQRFECNRCHEGTGLEPAPLAQNCFSCHEQIITGRFPVSAAALARFRPHVASAREAPSLVAVGARLESDWLVGYLLKPHDLRPNLVPTMPRLALDGEQARDIAAYLSARGPVSPGSESLSLEAASPRHGRELMEQKGCASCHVFSGVPAFTGFEPPAPGSEVARAAALAPDLRFTRQRFRSERLQAWLLDPKSIKADTRMPSFGLVADEARDIGAYLLRAELAPEPTAKLERLPVLTRRVSFEEANRRVFSRTCHHCHTDPESSGGDGGPGNTGGFGFAPRGVSFSSHSSILAGYMDETGKRRSLFEPLSDGTPRLIAALLARHDEERGTRREQVRGMPLGLPPLSAEDIQLVESWVAQGKPL